jgi:hypothetical protein
MTVLICVLLLIMDARDKPGHDSGKAARYNAMHHVT